jgi:hypothetical protein
MRAMGLPRTTIFQRLGDTKAGLDARKMSVSTAGEMTRLLELIARHEAVSPEASEDMLRIMRRQDYRHELSRLLPWNEMNMLENHKENWVAEKGGSFLNGIRTSGAVFSGPRGKFVMSVFCEGGTGSGTGRESEGNRLNGELGYAAWRTLAEEYRSAFRGGHERRPVPPLHQACRPCSHDLFAVLRSAPIRRADSP